MTNRYVCGRCGSENIIKKGFVNGKQRFQCKECKATFYGTKENKIKKRQKQQTKEQSKPNLIELLGARLTRIKASIDYLHAHTEF